MDQLRAKILLLILILPLFVPHNDGIRTYPKSYTGFSGDESASASHTTNTTVSSHAWSGNPREYTIGGVLSGIADIEHYFRQVLSDVEQLKLNNVVSLNEATQTMDTNPIKTAITVCSQLIQRQVYAIIVSKPKQGDLSPASVSYTAGFYHIPVIGISSRDSAFSDKNIHVSFLRTVPPYSHQADVWVEMLKQFKYRQLVFIHSSDTDGRALLGRFQTKTQDLQSDEQEVKVEKVEEFEPGRHSYLDTLLKIKECQARVYFLYASTSDADQLFQDAARLNMTGPGYVWIVTEQALESSHIPSGALGLQLVGASNERGHISDSLNILAQALLELHKKENVTEAPSNCNTSGALWQTGKRLFEYIRNQVLSDGTTGRVAFDSMGDRMYAEYQVINVQDDPRNNFVKGVIVGSYQYSKDEGKMRLQLDEENIIWPGGLTQKPTGLMIPTHLKVLTILEKPFVYARPVESEQMCDVSQGEIRCPVYNTKQHPKEDDTDVYCCRGYCIDLLRLLSETCNFTYSLHLSFNDYGVLDRNNVTGKQEWTGLIGELVNEKADLIVAPLTINPERAQVMEFSKPFKYQGITILQKRQPRASQLVSFLQPFKSTLWVLVLVSVHVVALCLYLLDRFSPFGRIQSSDSPTVGPVQKEESLNLTSAIWFAWGVLLNSGIGEGTPRSFSARVLGMVWAGFAMIIVASYTANLAAFLVLDKPQTSLTGINDPRLRNPMENFTYATVKGSAVDMYFRRQVELSNMYRTMEGKHYKTPEEAIAAVKSGALKAFIWDSSRLEFEAARDCDLITAGDLFGRSGYGVGLQKGSPWADKVTLAILDFHESGKMEDLDNSWILLNNEVDCRNNDDNSPATLGLKNMRGVFILVGMGIVGGLGLIIIEIIYKKHQIRKQKTVVAAKTAVKKWRGTVEKRRTIQKSKEEAKKLKSNGFRSSKAETPESMTLSVDSLPAAAVASSVASPPPPLPSSVTVAARKEWMPASPKIIGGMGGNGGASLHLLPEPPPPVPPHKTPTFDSRPRSALASGRKCASREDLTDHVTANVGTADRSFHRSVGNDLPKAVDHYCQWQQQQAIAQHKSQQQSAMMPVKGAKSPSSSDSSRKRHSTAVVATGSMSTGNHRDPWVNTVTSHYPTSSSRKEDVSSPECPSISTSSEIRHRIPMPPPPPRLYWQNRQQAAAAIGGGHNVVVAGGGNRRHTKDFVVRRGQYPQQQQQLLQQQQQQQHPTSHVYHRRHHRPLYTEDSDV